MKKNGVLFFVISHLVPEIFKIFELCKLGTDDVIFKGLLNSPIFQYLLEVSVTSVSDSK